ncbi:DsbA family protein [Entomobacter blattae]|uniref:Thioredoxin n=1 Tax=Entomobacter blattae TaxID=2762277 RepID=A0A7H1NQ59_9PROT|nr:DsbA family protein [Entomobacter blattae]QNT77919.1 Thioredoxin [Entomobacter blattae]
MLNKNSPQTSLLAAALGIAITGFPFLGHAQDSFTPAQRKEIISIVKEALKNDPSILSEALSSLQKRVENEEKASTTLALQTHQADLAGLPTDGIMGNINGKTVVVEFYDPRCPYCRRILPDLAQFIKEDNDVKLITKVIPILGPASTLEARAIVGAAKQNASVKLQQALMKDNAPSNLDRIKRLAQQQGLDVHQLLTDMEAPETTQAISNNLQLARDLNLHGTPAFIFGKTIVPGAISLADLKKYSSEAKAN